jgi:hypothetical protein
MTAIAHKGRDGCPLPTGRRFKIELCHFLDAAHDLVVT